MWALGFCGGLYEKDNPVGSYQSDKPLQSITSLDLSSRDICNLINKVSIFFQLQNYFVHLASNLHLFLYSCIIHYFTISSLLISFLLPFLQAFSPFEMPILSYLNIRGIPLSENSVGELLNYLRGFINLTVLEVTLSNRNLLRISLKLQ